MSYHAQRNCPECGYGSGGHHQSCPERPDEPEEDEDEDEVEAEADDEVEAVDETQPARARVCACVRGSTDIANDPGIKSGYHGLSAIEGDGGGMGLLSRRQC